MVLDDLREWGAAAKAASRATAGLAATRLELRTTDEDRVAVRKAIEASLLSWIG